MKLIATLLPVLTLTLAASTHRHSHDHDHSHSHNHRRQQQCSNPSVRVEWRSLAQEQRNQFHQAIKCLQTKPSSEEFQSLFDRYSSLHVDMFDDIHYVAAFAPWHRYFLQAREIGLRECGYAGPIPYWDWTRDSSNMAGSEMFDPVLGLGGNGKATTSSNGHMYNCVQDGPYGVQANFSIAYPETRCLQRKFTNGSRSSMLGNMQGSQHSSSVVSNIMKKSNFVDFWQALEEGPHDAVHNEIAGDMAAAFSPDDPLFFLHHMNVDRIWALWQAKDSARLQDYHGNTIQGQDANDDSRWPVASLDDTISLAGIQGLPDIKVRDVMDTKSGALCYVYDK
ncbi:Di-copper centre-containing protein [Ceratobasidium sp. AG-I]|nr:Di-copper centre-containing protein [Ceratobasidium sp. AG-I]